MLLCSSRIPVSEKLTVDAFVALAVEWVTTSRNYSFDPFEWDGSADYTCREKNEKFSKLVYLMKNLYALYILNLLIIAKLLGQQILF